MKKITEEEFAAIPFGKENKRKPNWGKASPFYKEIMHLKKNEITTISKEEWKGCRNPKRICTYIMKKFPHVKYFVKPLPGKSGWAIKRME